MDDERRAELVADFAKLRGRIRAGAFDDAARELESMRGAPEAEAAFKRAAQVLRLIAARERGD